MTRTGLAAASRHVPVTAKGETAARRIGAATDDVPAVAESPGYAGAAT